MSEQHKEIPIDGRGMVQIYGGGKMRLADFLAFQKAQGFTYERRGDVLIETFVGKPIAASTAIFTVDTYNYEQGKDNPRLYMRQGNVDISAQDWVDEWRGEHAAELTNGIQVRVTIEVMGTKREPPAPDPRLDAIHYS